jgi:hypothetical protein
MCVIHPAIDQTAYMDAWYNTIKLMVNTWLFETCRRQYNWIKSLIKSVYFVGFYYVWRKDTKILFCLYEICLCSVACYVVPSSWADCNNVVEKLCAAISIVTAVEQQASRTFALEPKFSCRCNMQNSGFKLNELQHLNWRNYGI